MTVCVADPIPSDLIAPVFSFFYLSSIYYIVYMVPVDSAREIPRLRCALRQQVHPRGGVVQTTASGNKYTRLRKGLGPPPSSRPHALPLVALRGFTCLVPPTLPWHRQSPITVQWVEQFCVISWLLRGGKKQKHDKAKNDKRLGSWLRRRSPWRDKMFSTSSPPSPPLSSPRSFLAAFHRPAHGRRKW